MQGQRNTAFSNQDPSNDPVHRFITRVTRTISFKQEAEAEAERGGPPLIEEKYSVYNNLTWTKLEGFLKETFPGYEFTENRVRS
jgi:hypothetical protein